MPGERPGGVLKGGRDRCTPPQGSIFARKSRVIRRKGLTLRTGMI